LHPWSDLSMTAFLLKKCCPLSEYNNQSSSKRHFRYFFPVEPGSAVSRSRVNNLRFPGEFVMSRSFAGFLLFPAIVSAKEDLMDAAASAVTKYVLVKNGIH